MLMRDNLSALLRSHPELESGSVFQLKVHLSDQASKQSPKHNYMLMRDNLSALLRSHPELESGSVFHLKVHLSDQAAKEEGRIRRAGGRKQASFADLLSQEEDALED
jgi:hypothetical protein